MISASLLLLYLVKVSAVIAAFYLFFILFLSRSTFFRLNRIYLLSGLLLSFAIPFLSFPGGTEKITIPDVFLPVSSQVFAAEEPADAYPSGEDTLSLNVPVLTLIYLAGFVFLFFRYLISFLRLCSFIRLNRVRKVGRALVIPIDTGSSFSFLNILFLSGNQNQRAVIAHERAHLHQHHWCDLFLSGAACVILWFNPVSWLYSRAIRQQHEYLADHEVLRKGISLSHYLELILSSLSVEVKTPLTNQFNSTSLKNRIMMMTQKKSSNAKALIYVLIVPMVAVLSMAFGKKETTPGGSVKTLTVVIDAAHGGDDAGASAGSLTEKDLSLTFARLIQSACEEKGITCILTRTDDRTISLKDRLSASKSAAPDLFISIHFSNDQKVAGGMNVLVSRENGRYEECVKLASLLLMNVKSFHNPGSIHQSSALVLKENTIPAVIIDLGNLAHPSDRDLVTSPLNQQHLSTYIADVIASMQK